MPPTTLARFAACAFALQCVDDLAVWCIVTTAILLVITAVSALDGACGLRGLGSDGLPSTSESDDGDVQPRQSFTVLAIVQLVALLSFVVAWAYGLFVVLNLFSRQHHALPGAELCDRHLYDPVFIIAVIVGLVLVLVPLVALCTCLASNLCVGEPSGSEGRRKKFDDLERGGHSGGAGAPSDAEEQQGLLAASDTAAGVQGAPVTVASAGGAQPKFSAGAPAQAVAAGSGTTPALAAAAAQGGPDRPAASSSSAATVDTTGLQQRQHNRDPWSVAGVDSLAAPPTPDHATFARTAAVDERI